MQRWQNVGEASRTHIWSHDPSLVPLASWSHKFKIQYGLEVETEICHLGPTTRKDLLQSASVESHLKRGTAFPVCVYLVGYTKAWFTSAQCGTIWQDILVGFANTLNPFESHSIPPSALLPSFYWCQSLIKLYFKACFWSIQTLIGPLLC